MAFNLDFIVLTNNYNSAYAYMLFWTLVPFGVFGLMLLFLLLARLFTGIVRTYHMYLCIQANDTLFIDQISLSPL